MFTILNDQSKFKQLKHIHLLHLILRCDKINRFLRHLKNLNTISPITYSTLFTSGSTPDIIYELPKTQKPNHPLIPILSACNTPNDDIAKYLVPLLTPLTTNQSTIKTSTNNNTFHNKKEFKTLLELTTIHSFI